MDSFFVSRFRISAPVVCVLLSMLFLGCAQGSCREIKENAKNQNPNLPPMEERKIPTGAADRIRVYKLDGSLQCEEAKGTDPEKMRSELDGLATYKTFKAHDGLMRIQLCGSPTGQVNVYEIDRNELLKAQKLGFREWIKE